MEHTDIKGSTRLLCLLGSPVEHSIRPQMHNLAFEMLGLDLRYLAFDVTTDQLETAVEGLRLFNALGWNLTMPLKTAMVPLCDELTRSAQLCGAVNTVLNQDGKLIGTSTDGLGWVLSAQAEGCDIRGKHMTILGAGGAASSILAECALQGIAGVEVFKKQNGTWEKAAAFIDKIRGETGCAIRIHDMADQQTLKRCIEESDVLLNATPVGMKGNPGCLIPDENWLHPELVVADAIYEPEETELLRMAKTVGCKAFNGKYMLLYQGAEAFRFWTDEDMPLEAVKDRYFS